MQMQMQMQMRILAQIPLLAGLSKDQLDSIDKSMVSLSRAEGDRPGTFSASSPELHRPARGSPFDCTATHDGHRHPARGEHPVVSG
jgi:hypothetical protein